MPYRVEFHGANVICDTVAEVKALLSDGQSDQHRGSAGEGWAGRQRAEAIPDLRRSDGKYSMVPEPEHYAAMESLSRAQLAFIELLSKEDGMQLSDADARSALRLDNNKQLAGLLGAIAKKFKNRNLPNPIQSDSRFKNGNRIYSYSLLTGDARILRSIQYQAEMFRKLPSATLGEEVSA